MGVDDIKFVGKNCGGGREFPTFSELICVDAIKKNCTTSTVSG